MCVFYDCFIYIYIYVLIYIYNFFIYIFLSVFAFENLKFVTVINCMQEHKSDDDSGIKNRTGKNCMLIIIITNIIFRIS